MDIISHIVDHYHAWMAIFLLSIGLYIMIVAGNLIKKLMGMSIFQTSVLLFYISVSKVKGGMAPILVSLETQDPNTQSILYTNPLPHVLMLTAIVVGVATLAVGLALIVRIKGAYGTVEEDIIIDIDNKEEEVNMEQSRKHVE